MPQERTVCGWEELSDAEHAVELDAAGVALRPVSPSTHATALVAPANLDFGKVHDRLKGAHEHLVRLKLVVDGRWLVPLTRYGGPPITPKPLASSDVETVVGHRRVIRKQRQPRVRLADLRIHRGASVQLFVENDKVTGTALSIDELKSHLRGITPPVGAFTIHADDDVKWANFVRTAAAAACYDRAPGFEPHEVIWDQRALAPPYGG